MRENRERESTIKKPTTISYKSGTERHPESSCIWTPQKSRHLDSFTNLAGLSISLFIWEEEEKISI